MLRQHAGPVARRQLLLCCGQLQNGVGFGSGQRLQFGLLLGRHENDETGFAAGDGGLVVRGELAGLMQPGLLRQRGAHRGLAPADVHEKIRVHLEQLPRGFARGHVNQGAKTRGNAAIAAVVRAVEIQLERIEAAMIERRRAVAAQAKLLHANEFAGKLPASQLRALDQAAENHGG